MIVTIVLPLPHKHLSPNARCVWQAKSRATKKARGDSYLATLDAMQKAGIRSKPHWKTATVQATFYKQTKRRADADNALSSCKAYFDGMTDAGLIDDDSGLTHAPVVFEVDKADPRVELVVTRT